jgi:hypothetical protein
MNRKKNCYGGIKSYLSPEDEESNKSVTYEPPLPEVESSSVEINRTNPKAFRVKFVMVGDQHDIKLNIKQKIKDRIKFHVRRKAKREPKKEGPPCPNLHYQQDIDFDHDIKSVLT